MKFPDSWCRCGSNSFKILSGRGVPGGVVWLCRCNKCGHEWEVFQQED